MVSTKILRSTTAYNINNEIIRIFKRNVSWAANQHIRISKGSCDTEDWSNDATKNLLCITNQL